MKITLGEYATRDGRKAIVAAINEQAGSPVIGWVTSEAGLLYPWDWQLCGSHFTTGAESEFDLVAPWSDPVPWDWSTTPPWINWIAMDAIKVWYMYDNEPEELEKAWSFTGRSCHRIPKSHEPQWTGDWKLSRTQRPKEVSK